MVTVNSFLHLGLVSLFCISYLFPRRSLKSSFKSHLYSHESAQVGSTSPTHLKLTLEEVATGNLEEEICRVPGQEPDYKKYDKIKHYEEALFKKKAIAKCFTLLCNVRDSRSNSVQNNRLRTTEFWMCYHQTKAALSVGWLWHLSHKHKTGPKCGQHE